MPEPSGSAGPPPHDPGAGLLARFAAAGLWPGIPRKAADALAGSGLRTREDVTASRLVALPGIGPARAPRLARALADAGEVWRVAELLDAADLPLRPAARLAAQLGPGSAAALRADPWRLLLLPEVRLTEADRLAASVGLTRAHPARGPAVLMHLLAAAAAQGHTCQPRDALVRLLAGRGVPDPAGAVSTAARSGDVLTEQGVVAAERYARAEQALAENLARLLRTARPWPAGPAGGGGHELDGAQRAAVAAALAHGVSLLTGGPGTGKSRTVATLVAAVRAGGRTVALAAPTGRAARRLEELGDAPASTLHRLLGAQGTTGAFSRDANWPLDADLVVVDEASMLDAELAAALVSACPDGSHLLLVGDPDQLPSIGAGRVLGDLLDSGLLQTTALHTLYRQQAGGQIARLAAAIRAGSAPPVDDPQREVVIVPASGAAEAAHRVVQLVTDSIPRVLGIGAGEVQVVTPVHRGAAGTAALNSALKARLNPGPGAHRGFDPGDRVVALANRPDAGFANGEVGGVLGAADGGGLRVLFSTGEVAVPAEAVGDLALGFAITVHRAQGSEWPAVVFAVPPEASGMLSRPLVYTAVTRARRHLSVVPAVGPALSRAVEAVGAAPRLTRLPGLLARSIGESPGAGP